MSPLSTDACRPVPLSTDPTAARTTRVALRNVERMTPGKAQITLSRPGDLLGVVPYLVGFHPEESVVAVMLRSGRVVLTIRVDVPPASGAADLAAQIARLVVQHGAQHLVLIGYSINPQIRELLMEMAWKLTPSGLQDVLFVDGQRWWSLMCAGDCCPSDGQPYDPRSSPIAAQAVYAGLAARPDRRALEADVSGPAEDEHPELSRLVGQESRYNRWAHFGRALRPHANHRCELLETTGATGRSHVRSIVPVGPRGQGPGRGLGNDQREGR